MVRTSGLDAPDDYPRYAENVGSQVYYAVYLTDPDGIKLEFAFMPKTPNGRTDVVTGYSSF